MKPRLNYLLPVSSGVLASFSLFSVYTNYVVLIVLVPLLLFFNKEVKLSRLWLGSFFYHFIFVIIAGLYVMVEPLVWLLTSLVFSFLGLCLWLIKKYAPFSLFWPLASILFVVFEFFSTYFIYVPMKLSVLGNTLGSTWFLPLGKIFGLWGLSLAVVLVNLLLALTLDKMIKRQPVKKALITAVIVVGALVILNIGLKNLPQKSIGEKTIKLAAVSFQMTAPDRKPKYKELFSGLDQINNPLVESYTDELIKDIKDKLTDPVDYLFLPADILDTSRKGDAAEDIFKQWGINNNGALIKFSQKLARETGSNLIIGMTTIEQEDKKYNSILFFNKNGELKNVYHKIDLVIGSEYWPFGPWVPFWFYWTANIDPGERIHIDPGYTRGEEPIKPAELDGLTIGALVCSEAQNGSYFAQIKKRGAELAFTPINNDWFNARRVNYYKQMLLNHLRINSIYYNLPVVVNGKDNYAGIILPNGDLDINNQNDAADITVWQGEVVVKEK